MTKRNRPFRSRKYTNRIGAGIALIALAIAGVWFTIDLNDRTNEFVVAAKPMASGSAISSDSFKTVRMNLGSSAKLYARPGELKLGFYLAVPLEVGQLVPYMSVATEIIDARQPVIVSSTMPVPDALKAGDEVDVWVSDLGKDNKFSEPVKIIMNAEVSQIVRASGMLGDQPPKIQLLIPTESVKDVLGSIASKDAISVVLKRKLGHE